MSDVHDFLRGRVAERANPPPSAPLLSPPSGALLEGGGARFPNGQRRACADVEALWSQEFGAMPVPEVAAALARLVRRSGQAQDGPRLLNLLCDLLERGTVVAFADADRLWRRYGVREGVLKGRSLGNDWVWGNAPEAGLALAVENLLTILTACSFRGGRWYGAQSFRYNVREVLNPLLDALRQSARMDEPDLYVWARKVLLPGAPRMIRGGLLATSWNRGNRVRLTYERPGPQRTLLARIELVRGEAPTPAPAEPDARRFEPAEPVDRLMSAQVESDAALYDEQRLIARDLVLRGVRVRPAPLAGNAAFGPFQSAGWRAMAAGWQLANLTNWPDAVAPSMVAIDQGRTLVELIEDLLFVRPRSLREAQAGPVRALLLGARALGDEVDVDLGWWFARLADPEQPPRLVAADWADPWSAVAAAGALDAPDMRRLLNASQYLSDGLEGTDVGDMTVTGSAGLRWRTNHQGEAMSTRSFQHGFYFLLDLLRARGVALSMDEATGMLRTEVAPPRAR